MTTRTNAIHELVKLLGDATAIAAQLDPITAASIQRAACRFLQDVEAQGGGGS